MTASAPQDERHPAEVVAARVLALPEVVGLDGGTSGQVATYLPGRRVAGVSWHDDACEVSVVLRLSDRTLPDLADEVRRAVVPLAGGRDVHVAVADVVTPAEQLERSGAPLDPYEQG